MKQGEDRRVTRTRRLLRQALVKRMREKSVSSITVKELCDECDINRGTFYSHYSDVAALLESIENDLFAQLQQMLAQLSTEEMLSRNSPSRTMVALFEFLRENADICAALLCDNGDPAFIERVRAFVRREVLGEWRHMFSDGDGERQEYTFAFLVSGSMGMLQHWLESGLTLTPEQMAAMLTEFITQGVAVMR